MLGVCIRVEGCESISEADAMHITKKRDPSICDFTTVKRSGHTWDVYKSRNPSTLLVEKLLDNNGVNSNDIKCHLTE